jgi:nitrogen PTS system EIIA component
VAVPHARLPTITKPIIAVGRASKPIAFNAPDKVAVRLVFLILTPASQPLEQLRILSRVATLINNQTLRRGLMRAKNAHQFLDIVRTSEALVTG